LRSKNIPRILPQFTGIPIYSLERAHDKIKSGAIPLVGKEEQTL